MSFLLIAVDRWCPEENSGVFSRLFFTFCNSIVSLGYHKILEQDDLWSLARCDEACVVMNNFRQKLEATKKNKSNPSVSARGFVLDAFEAISAINIAIFNINGTYMFCISFY